MKRFILSGLIWTMYCFWGPTQSGLMAQGNPQVLHRESGVVFGGNPVLITISPEVEKLNLVVKKIGGRARAEVSIQVGPRRLEKHTLRFSEGQQNVSKNTSINLKPDQEVKFEITNLSVGKKFQYELLVYE